MYSALLDEFNARDGGLQVIPTIVFRIFQGHSLVEIIIVAFPADDQHANDSDKVHI